MTAVLDRTTTGPLTYVGWLAAGRKVRHGEHGHRPAARPDGRPRAHVFDLDQTDPHETPTTVPTRPHPPTTYREADRMTDPQPLPPGTGSPAPLSLATCTYQEFKPDMGIPVKTTVGHPRFRLGYTLAGHARTVSPVRAILGLPKDAYERAYRQILETAGIDRIRAELSGLAPHGGRVVLLCFDKLAVPQQDGTPNWCHRTMFARWYEERTGEVVPELGATPCVSPATLF